MLYCAKISKRFHRLLILLKVKKSLVCVTVHSLSAGGYQSTFSACKIPIPPKPDAKFLYLLQLNAKFP